jgi:glycosyltransferase involved in cell wall biosynthesis
MTFEILHLTHTDPRYDGRVLKQMEVHQRHFGKAVIALGLEISEAAIISKTTQTKIYFDIINLNSRAYKWLPKFMRYSINILELTAKMVVTGYKCKPKIIQCHDTMVLPAGWLLSKLLKTKLVYDAHELESQKGSQSKILSFATLLIENFCWSRIDLLITVSEEISAWYCVKFGKKKSIVVYNSPIEINQYSTSVVYDEGYLREKFNIPDHHLIFIYIGVIVPGRSLEVCSSVLSKLSSSASLVILGYGYDDDFHKSIKNYSDVYGNIYIHDAVPHEDVTLIARSADVGLCFLENASLSDYLALPNKFFEYACAGVPIICSNFPALKRMIDLHGIGYSVKPDKKDIQELIQGVISNPEVCKKFKPSQELTWSGQSKKIERAFDELAHQN